MANFHLHLVYGKARMCLSNLEFVQRYDMDTSMDRDWNYRVSTSAQIPLWANLDGIRELDAKDDGKRSFCVHAEARVDSGRKSSRTTYYEVKGQNKSRRSRAMV